MIKRIESDWLEVSDYVCPCGQPTSGPTLRWILNVATTPLRWCYHKFLSLQLIWRDFAALFWDFQGCIVLWSIYPMTEHTNVPQMSLFCCHIHLLRVWLKHFSFDCFAIWEKDDISTWVKWSAVVCTECTVYRVYTQVKTPGPKVTWISGQTKMREVRTVSKWQNSTFRCAGCTHFSAGSGGREGSNESFQHQGDCPPPLLYIWCLVACQALWSTFLSTATEFLFWRPVGIAGDH